MLRFGVALECYIQRIKLEPISKLLTGVDPTSGPAIKVRYSPYPSSKFIAFKRSGVLARAVPLSVPLTAPFAREPGAIAWRAIR